MYLELDGKGPYYGQITRALKGALLGGRLGTGARLPPSRMLARELGVSRNTVVAAYDQLRAEGYLEGRVGSGSFVVTLKRGPKKLGLRSVVTDTQPPSRYARRARKTASTRFSPVMPNRELRYNLQYGAPFINPTLTTAWSRELARAARLTSPDYAPTQGLPELRHAVADYLARRRGVEVSADDVLIVSGTQQAVGLVARVLLEEGDPVILEEPSYFGARQVLNAHGARLVYVPVDDDGLITDELPAIGAKLVFVTPSHQFPTGATLSLQRRLDLLRYASAERAWILEDDYDGEFRYDARPLAALRSLDTQDRVIYTGTLSKSMFPSMRLGYLVMPQALKGDFIAAKWLADLSSPAVEQAALAHFMADGGFERHLRATARTLKERRAVLIAGLEKYGRGAIELRGANAGMHLTAWLPTFSATQATELIRRSAERGVGLYTIARHYQDEEPPRPGLLMGYAGLAAGELEAAMRVFGSVFESFR